MNTRADRGDWDMHPSDADPQVPEVVDPTSDELLARTQREACGVEYSCATEQRRRRSIEDEEADDVADAYEADYYRRSE